MENTQIANGLAYEVTHIYDGINISEKELNRLLSIASWDNQVPNFKAAGRVSWENLEEEITLVNHTNQRYYAAKLKGVGVYNPPSKNKYSGVILETHSTEPQYPTMQTWDDLITYPHMGITNDLAYSFVYSSPSPVGGILHERALAEYRLAKEMLEAGIPTIAPLAVIKYHDYHFEGKPMGAVLTLSPSASHFRSSEVLWGAAVNRGKNPEADAYYDRMRAALGIEGKPNDEETRLQVMRAIALKMGKLIHDFSFTGFYRYSSEWSNYMFSEEDKQLYFIDLDSSRILEEDKLSPSLQTLQVLRDLATVLYRSTAKLAYPTVVDKLSLKTLLKYNPLLAVLQGYFPEQDKEELEKVARRLYNLFIPYWFQLKKYREPIANLTWDRERRKTYKMDHDMFYILAITSLFPIFKTSAIGQKYASDVDMDFLLNMASDYLGYRYEHFLYLLHDGEGF